MKNKTNKKIFIIVLKVFCIFLVTAVAAFGVPVTAQHIVVEVDGVKSEVKVDGIYKDSLHNELKLGEEGRDFKYDTFKSKSDFLVDIEAIKISTKKNVKLITLEGDMQVETFAHTLEDFLMEQELAMLPTNAGLLGHADLKLATDNKSKLLSNTILKETLEHQDIMTEYIENPKVEIGIETVVQEGVSQKIRKVLKTDNLVSDLILFDEVFDEGKPTIIEKGTKSVVKAPAVPSDSVWDKLAACESGGRWGVNTGNGYYGGLQFSEPTWKTASQKVGLNLAYASDGTREEQILAATWLQNNSGWGQWPSCSKKLGLL
ncbi:hypothetical protein AwErysi_08030 [Erysipelotrichaceae bacterium]|nr:hypothetical protein AwErysi_08030 [Erysipelotrichaceae bacterium]